MALFEDIESRAKEKAGPLPVWAWAVVILGGGYLAYRYYQSKQAPTNTEDTNAVATDSSATDDGGGSQFGPFYQVNYQPPPTEPTGIPIVTSSKATYLKNARNLKTYKVVGNKISVVTATTFDAAQNKRTETPTFLAVMDSPTGSVLYPHPIYEIFGGTRVKLTRDRWEAAKRTERATAVHVKKDNPALRVPNAADQILY